MILDVKKNIFFGILLSLITFLFIFIPGFKVKAEDDYVLKPTDILISSDDLKSVSGDAIKGNLTYADIQEIVSNNPDYDFVNEYKYFVILLKHWDRSNINGNVLEIMFFDKQPLISDTILVTNEMNRLTYTVGKINSNFIIDFDNLDLTQPLEYESLYRSSTDISKEFANGVYYLAFDNLNPSSYIKPKFYTYDYQYDKKRGPLDKLYSIDYIFDSNTFTSDTAIQYEINYIDEYEKYSDENISSYLYLNGFKFYGLVNNDGLYHWEELDNTSNSYVDDYEDYYQDGKYYFNVKKMNLDFTNYEKIIFRSIFFNDNYLESAVTRSNNEKISRDDVFYNTVFGPTYLNMQFDTKELFYLNITSTLSEYKSRWYTWDYSDSDPYKQPYLNYFDLTTSQFVSESHGLPLYYANDLNYDFIEKHDVVIGTSTNKGVVITEEFKKRSVGGLVFTYREQFTYNVIFEFKDLYFSYNNTKLIVTITCDDGTERTDMIDLSI